MSCPLMCISSGNSMMLVIIISLPLRSIFSKQLSTLSFSERVESIEAIEVRLKAAAALLLKQMLSLYSAVLLNFAVELCYC